MTGLNCRRHSPELPAVRIAKDLRKPLAWLGDAASVDVRGILWVRTPNGNKVAHVGDTVVEEAPGAYWVYDPERFAATYDVVEGFAVLELVSA